MAARRLRRDAGREGEFLRGPGAPVHEGGEDVGAGGIAHQGRRLGEEGIGSAHGPIGRGTRRAAQAPTLRRAAEAFAPRQAPRRRLRWRRHGDPHAPHAPSWSDCALLLALASLWGASYTFIKIGVATIPPVTLIAAGR